MSEHEYFTPEQIAAKLQVKTRTVQEWLRTGRLTGAKLGKLWRVRAEDLDAFIGASLNGAAAGPVSPVADDADQVEQAVETGHVGERLLALMDQIWKDVPEEELAKLPTDLAEQHDHYAWGLPKRPR